MHSGKTRLWWLHPAWPLGLVVGSTLLFAFLQTEQAYALYGVPKYVAEKHVALGALYIFVFVIGCFLAIRLYDSKPKKPADKQHSQKVLSIVNKMFLFSFGLTLFGYSVWLAVGVLNGFSPGVFVEFVRGGNPELPDQLKYDIFLKLPGITTCTQFGYAATAMGLWLYFQHRKKHYLVMALSVTAMAFFRGFLVSERLVFIELLFPWFFIWLRLLAMNSVVRELGFEIRRFWQSRIFWSALRISPFIAPLIAVMFFGSFEYFRSWQYYQDEFESFTEFTSWRLAGYFTTAHNNGAMAMEVEQVRPLPYSTIRPYWQLPGIPQSSISYEALTGYEHEEDVHDAMLENYGSIELNNEGGVFQPILDWGLPLSILFWFGYGYLAGSAYRAFLAGSFWGVTLYPIVFLSLLEVPLILVLLYTISTPPLAMLCLTYYLTRQKRVGQNANLGLGNHMTAEPT